MQMFIYKSNYAVREYIHEFNEESFRIHNLHNLPNYSTIRSMKCSCQEIHLLNGALKILSN